MPSTIYSVYFINIAIAFAYKQPISKSVQLTPLNSNTNGASVNTNTPEVITNTNNEWVATINNQNTWQFTINLDENWSFNTQNPSSIKFTVNSKCSVDDMLFGFSINNNKFFSIWLPMNNDGRKNRIHPTCDTFTIPTATLSSGNIYTLPNDNRMCDIAPGNGKHGCLYASMKPKNAQTPNVFAYNDFPITFTLENNPNDNTFFISYHSAVFGSNFIEKCGFIGILDSKTLNIYIGGNQIGNTFSISSFDIEYNAIENIVSETTKTVSSDSISSENIIVAGGGAIIIDKNDVKKASKSGVKYMILGMSVLALLMVMIIGSIFLMYYRDVYGEEKYDMRNIEIIGGECEISTSHDDSLSDLLDEESDEMPNETDFTDCIEEDILDDFDKNKVVDFMENGRMFDLINH